MARWRGVAACLALAVAAGCGGSAGDNGDDASGDLASKRVFSFAVWGDTPYSPAEAQALSRMVDEINAAGVDFTVMVGDIFGGERCDNKVYTAARDTFNSFQAPLVYTPGDNEWTDCHTFGQDPVERLDYIRRTMFATSRSFGQRTLALTQQRPQYPENARWRVGPVLFITLHVVGSNNNHIPDVEAEEQFTPRTAADRQAAEREYQARDQANRDWLRQGFAEAARTNAEAVVVVMQADPAFDVPAAERHGSGFNALLAAFAAEASSFPKPILIVHGDSHRLTIDQPLVDLATGRRFPNVSRAESFGSPDVGWVKVTVDLSRPEPFRSEPHLVESFRPN